MAHTDDDAEISLTNFALKAVRVQLDIEASPCIEMIFCRPGTFQSQATMFLLTKAPILVSQLIFLPSKQIDMFPLCLENVFSLVT